MRVHSMKPAKIALLFIMTVAAWLGGPSRGYAQGPPVVGLRFWLDASDMDANPNTKNPTQDAAVAIWKDKIRGITLVQDDWLRQPVMGQLKNAEAVHFDKQSHLIATGLENVAFAGDTGGTIVQMFNARPLNEWSLAGLEIADSKSTAYIATHVCANGCWGTGLVGGLAIQANNGPFKNAYFSGRATVADGEFHIAIIASNTNEWLFNTDGKPVTTVEKMLGKNEGQWFADMPNVDTVNFGNFTAGTGKPSASEPGHIGSVGDILIYDHLLNEEEMAKLSEYAFAKYKKPAGVPPAPSAPFATRAYVELAWDAIPEDVLGYNVYRKSRVDDEYERINESTVKTPRFVDYDIVPGRTYYYAVCSVNYKYKTEGDKSEAIKVVP